MTQPDIVRDYLTLGLRMGTLIDGYVDSWFGDPALAARVVAEPRVPAPELAAEATRLLDRLPDSGLSAGRCRFLHAQLLAIRCAAQRAAGAPMGFRAEVETYFGVPIDLGDTGRYTAVHDAIDELLPGAGRLSQRVEDFYARNVVPPDRLLGAVRTVSEALEDRIRPLLDLPDGQHVHYEIVEDRPWNAFNRYHGDYRSTVTLNVTAGRTIAALPLMATHESYPGHHTEHCLKEAGLVRARGQQEHTIALVNTPQCLVAEGTAELAVTALLGDGWGEWTRALLAGQGVHTDGALVEQLTGLIRQLMPARQDAAILLHDRGADVDEAVDYLHRWLLLPRDRAAQMTAFLTDPLWRAYSVTYIEGARLVGAWLGDRPGGEPILDRYRTLLREQLLPADLTAG
jgi:hypothetical protein